MIHADLSYVYGLCRFVYAEVVLSIEYWILYQYWDPSTKLVPKLVIEGDNKYVINIFYIMSLKNWMTY